MAACGLEENTETFWRKVLYRRVVVHKTGLIQNREVGEEQGRILNWCQKGIEEIVKMLQLDYLSELFYRQFYLVFITDLKP